MITYEIDEAVTEAYKRVSTRKSKAIVLKIDKVENKEKIVLEKEIGKADFNHETFVNELPDLECRYVIFLYEYSTEDGIISDQIFYILYNPTKCKPNQKFRYASGRGSIEGAFTSISKTIQVGGKEELAEEKFAQRVK